MSNNEYAFLNDLQWNNPIQVIWGSTIATNLFDDRQCLFNLFFAAISSSTFEDYDADMMKAHVDCFVRVIQIVEASYRVGELIMDEQFIYSYSKDIEPR
jgi:hypothetical protein